jgi:hypothetical protein
LLANDDEENERVVVVVVEGRGDIHEDVLVSVSPRRYRR